MRDNNSMVQPITQPAAYVPLSDMECRIKYCERQHQHACLRAQRAIIEAQITGDQKHLEYARNHMRIAEECNDWLDSAYRGKPKS